MGVSSGCGRKGSAECDWRISDTLLLIIVKYHAIFDSANLLAIRGAFKQVNKGKAGTANVGNGDADVEYIAMKGLIFKLYRRIGHDQAHTSDVHFRIAKVF